MVKFILVAIITWIIGVFGWSQIIGSIQNIQRQNKLLFTLILWIIIMGISAWFIITKLDSLWALAIGYVISLIQVFSSGRIE